MGCGNEVKKKSRKMRKLNNNEIIPGTDEVLHEDDQVACSVCGDWCTLEMAGITGMSESEIEQMDVYCMKCMHRQHSKVKMELSECLKRVERLEGTINKLMTERMMDGSQSVPKNVSGRRRKRSLASQMHQDTLLEGADTSVVGAGEQSFAEAVSSPPQCAAAPVLSSPVRNEEQPNQENMSSDGDDEASNSTEEQAFKTVQRRKKKCNIKIVGDSMVKYVTKVVRCDKDGSGHFYKSGAGIKEIVEKTVVEANSAREGSLIVIQGGGNSLRHIGSAETVKSILECVADIRKERKDLNIAVTSVLPRPRENGHYEQLRKQTNNELQKQICKLRWETVKSKEAGGISFLDMDCVLNPQMFAQDGVHFNHQGVLSFGKRIISWIKEKERVPMPHHQDRV